MLVVDSMKLILICWSTFMCLRIIHVFVSGNQILFFYYIVSFFFLISSISFQIRNTILSVFWIITFFFSDCHLWLNSFLCFHHRPNNLNTRRILQIFLCNTLFIMRKLLLRIFEWLRPIYQIMTETEFEYKFSSVLCPLWTLYIIKQYSVL